MAIQLVTGLPGHGKTLYTLAKYQHVSEPPPKGEARAVFHCSGQADREKRGQVHGIPGLALPWTPIDPEKWHELPAGSLLIVDEAQFIFPVRPGRGDPADWIARLATHRHLGIDIVLVTQHPKLVDSFVLRLVDQHFHIRRKFGTSFATIYESANGVREYPEKSVKDMIRHEWKYPKTVYGLYTSAELHTVKRRLPMRFYVLLCTPVVFIGLAWYAYTRLNPSAQASRVSGEHAAPASSAPGASGVAPGRVRRAPGSPIRDADEGVRWVANFAPRVSGLPHTAPAYDHLTRPVEAPYPAYCVSLGSGYPCKCYTQRGTSLDVPLATCESIAKGGFFAYWEKPKRELDGVGKPFSDTTHGQASLPAAAPSPAPIAAVAADVPTGGL